MKIQLLLNIDDPNQSRVNQLVNKLALTANGWEYGKSTFLLLGIQSELLDATKLLVYSPGSDA
jgi:hypothetical protein